MKLLQKIPFIEKISIMVMAVCFINYTVLQFVINPSIVTIISTVLTLVAILYYVVMLFFAYYNLDQEKNVKVLASTSNYLRFYLAFLLMLIPIFIAIFAFITKQKISSSGVGMIFIVAIVLLYDRIFRIVGYHKDKFYYHGKWHKIKAISEVHIHDFKVFKVLTIENGDEKIRICRSSKTIDVFAFYLAQQNAYVKRQLFPEEK